MYFLGTNAASIMNKSESFYRNINLFKPAAFFLQETKTRFKNKLKHPEYSFFEYMASGKWHGTHVDGDFNC